MANKTEQPKEELKEYEVVSYIKLGSNKDGSPKKSLEPGDKIKLSEKRAEVLLKQKKIK